MRKKNNEPYRDLRLTGLGPEELSDILNNCCSNIFVTDGKGKIIYVNSDGERSLNTTLENLLTMDIYELKERGYTSHSSTDDALKSGERAIAVYRNNLGEEIATTSVPVYGEDGKVKMVVTRSNEVGIEVAFQEEISRLREEANSYQDALERLNSIKSGGVKMVAEDPSMRAVIQTLNSVSLSDSTIMLYGESGTGKEVLANYVREHSLRKDKIFVPINCATIPNELMESELFGYERGAFTGADKNGKAGLCEIANGGTIFMDEIGELSLAAQSKLLRVLETGEFMRVGGTKTRKTNVRIIGATNRDLLKMIEEKQFRDDLYYRLNVVPVRIPPLRERPMDLDALSDFFLEKYNRKHGKKRKISSAMRNKLKSYKWPGNIRELRNAVERFVITGEEFDYAASGMVTGKAAGSSQAAELRPGMSALEYLKQSEKEEEASEKNGGNANDNASEAAGRYLESAFSGLDTKSDLRSAMGRLEWAYIREVISECEGSVSKAAKRLGIHRSVLYKKIDRYKEAGEQIIRNA